MGPVHPSIKTEHDKMKSVLGASLTFVLWLHSVILIQSLSLLIFKTAILLLCLYHYKGFQNKNKRPMDHGLKKHASLQQAPQSQKGVIDLHSFKK